MKAETLRECTVTAVLIILVIGGFVNMLSGNGTLMLLYFMLAILVSIESYVRKLTLKVK